MLDIGNSLEDFISHYLKAGSFIKKINNRSLRNTIEIEQQKKEEKWGYMISVLLPPEEKEKRSRRRRIKE